ncbi:excinuclease ABC subunit B [Salipiger bermudensis]|uniref:excinuclease ABC subunit B n=1 Tax=Salipiger bermudensis TaxID=344736 RepID=UPI001C98F30A|nr:excinuclease ABC subunit B [Salipiger bermudensis]MBY6002627.1 excinuclease ABC subunit B [Salipiger bermudensis]
MRLTTAIPLIGLLALTACATPREACIRDAAAPWRGAVAERERIAQDLARGYTFKTEFERVERQRWCRNGAALYPCWTTDTQPVTRRIPVDAEALRARDAELAAAIPALRSAAEADVRQCQATYPEESTPPG